VEFLRDADLIVHDAQYSEEEYATKRGWGHSTIDYATDIAAAANARRLALFHHDPTHDDAWIERAEAAARGRAAAAGSSLHVFAAAEGLELNIEGDRETRATSPVSALAHRPISGARVLLADADSSRARLVEQALAEDGLTVDVAPTGALALEAAAELVPDMVIVHEKLPDGAGAGFIHGLRARAGKLELPALLLTTENSESSLYSAETMSTDYLAIPFTPPMMRTRVRAWLTRTMNAREAEGVPLEPRKVRLRLSMPDGLTYEEIQASVELFAPLTMDQLDRLLSRASQRVFPAGQPVILQGEPAHAAYVVLSGRVRVVESLPDSPVEMSLGELGRGQIFGELGLLQNRPRSATIVPVERTACLVLPEDALTQALAESPGMALVLVRVLAGRLYEADRLLARFGPDPLTGLPGRRAFNDLYMRLVASVRRRGSGISLIFLDVQRLKDLNDRFGYEAGDGILKAVADVLIESSRVTDLVVRCGADEFAAVLVDAPEEQTRSVVSRLRERLEAEIGARQLPAAVLRVGIAWSASPPETVEPLLRQADDNSRAPTPQAEPLRQEN
jgi:diguanylate cyclase (GGDEF)-like protein